MANVKNNLRAGTFPQTTDDVSQGYGIGSIWFDGTVRFQCTDATLNAAVWAIRGGAGLVRLQTGIVTAAATLDVVLASYGTTFRSFHLELANFIPANAGDTLWGRLSANGGSSYDAGSTDYRYANTIGYGSSDNTWSGIRSTGASKMVMGEAVAAALGGWSGAVVIRAPDNAAIQPMIKWDAVGLLSGYEVLTMTGAGHRQSAQKTDALRFLFSTGNIASGKYTLYGYA